MRKIIVSGFLAAIVLPAAPAFAHTGAGTHHSFFAGFEHPLFGWDHLLAMVAVGLWAGLLGRRAAWLLPSAFLAGMVAGGVLGMAGIALPAVEHFILASVLLLGIATALALRVPLALGAALVALLGIAHGNAHGLEAPLEADGLAYVIGFFLATAALHGAGVAASLAARASQKAWIARIVGAACAVAGAVVAVS